TTLMNLLGALDKPTTGKIYFEGKEISALPENKRDDLRRTQIGFIFQSVALISQMSAYENVEFALRLAGTSRKEWRPRVEDSLSTVGLKKRMKHRPAELSGGEQQRVAIARAIAHRPSVVFADEPTAELDTHMALQVMRLFRELVQKEGVTVVMTTHDPNMMELGDHVYTLQDGEIVDEKWNDIAPAVPEKEDADE
ncbi:MAG: ABC transporter ATP-binding protein, partial [Eubacteriales bacterium]|nr:ABC transporter ATP-binding protein [Eubacteriales bacterium]